MKNWLVVANSSRARVLEETAQRDVFFHRADLVHPASRLKAQQIGAGLDGHVEGGSRDPGNAGFQQRTDPHEREHQRFAVELAQLVNKGVARGDCAGLVLVASNPFLGQIKAELSGQASKILLRVIAKDYTALRDDELARQVNSLPQA